MILPGGVKRTWLIPIVLSLLLHVPIVLLFTRLPMTQTYSEPVLKLSLRSIPAAPKMVRTAPPTAGMRQESQPKQQPGQQERAVIPQSRQKTQAESQSGRAAKSTAESNAADQQVTEAEPSVGMSAGMTAAQAQSSAHTDPVEAGKLTILKRVVPDYPAFSRKRGEEGKVSVIALIRGGVVIEAKISKSSGYPRLDQSAVRAAKSWRFAETEELQVIIPFLFDLTD